MYLYFKAIHIVFVVSWMAGLFYSVRLFIYHTETLQKTEPERSILQKQFELMEWRLWYIITTPAMVLSVLAGIGMLWLNPFLMEQDWMWVKLAFVMALLLYHFSCQHILSKFKQGIYRWTSTQLRIWNEVATLLLVAIVFTVVLKTTMDWAYGLSGLVALGVGMMFAVNRYKKYRQR